MSPSNSSTTVSSTSRVSVARHSQLRFCSRDQFQISPQQLISKLELQLEFFPSRTTDKLTYCHTYTTLRLQAYNRKLLHLLRQRIDISCSCSDKTESRLGRLPRCYWPLASVHSCPNRRLQFSQTNLIRFRQHRLLSEFRLPIRHYC